MRIGQAEDSGKFPCGVCKEGVGDNSIKCVACHKWVHKRSSGISGRLRYDAGMLVVEGARGQGRGRKTWELC